MKTGNPWVDAPLYGDVYQLDVHSSTRANFERAIRIAMSHKHDKATHYMAHEDAGLILFWCNPKIDHAYPLPNEMDTDAAIDFAWQWLCSLNHDTVKAYAGEPPSIDGDVRLGGFRVYNEEWGQVLHHFAGIVAVKPEYILLGR